MLCDGSPDLLSTSELNTFMNLWRDDKESKPFDIVLREGEDTLKVICCDFTVIHKSLLLSQTEGHFSLGYFISGGYLSKLILSQTITLDIYITL